MWTSYKQLNLSDSLVWGRLRLCAVTLSTGSPAVRFRGSTEGMARSMSWVTLWTPVHSYPWKVSEIQHRHSNGLGRDHGVREKRHCIQTIRKHCVTDYCPTPVVPLKTFYLWESELKGGDLHAQNWALTSLHWLLGLLPVLVRVLQPAVLGHLSLCTYSKPHDVC